MTTEIKRDSVVTFKRVGTKTKVKSFRIIDINVYDEKKNKEQSISSGENGKQGLNKDESQFIIQIFGVNEEGDTCCIYVNDFNPFFFVKVGDDWTQRNVNGFLSEIRKSVGKYYEIYILGVVLVEKH